MKKKSKDKSGKKSSKRSSRTEEVEQADESEAPEDEEPAEEEGTDAPPPSGKRGRPSSIPYDKFVKAWTTASTVSGCAAQLGIHANSASAIANRLRKAGIKLKKFSRRNAQPIDVKALNKIAGEAE